MTPAVRLAFVWSSFGPYHIARCEAVANAVPDGVNVLGVELGQKTVTYDWLVNRDQPRNFELSSLTTKCAEHVGPWHAFKTLRRLLRGRRCDAIFLPSYWPAPNLALLAAAKSLRLPTVMMNETHHGTARPGILRHAIKKYIVGKFDAALLGGTKQREYFSGLGVDARQIFLGYDAIDNSHFELASDAVRRTSQTWRDKLGLPERYILSLGRMVRKKNCEAALDAFAALKRAVPAGPALVFVGSGPGEAALEQKARDHGLSVVDRRNSVTQEHGDVYFYGFRQIDENPAFYALADAFILASFQEEWGLVVNEAMASATPVIVSSAAGCADDLVIDGHTGWTFDPTSVTELTAVLRSALSNVARLREVGINARAHVRNWDCGAFARNALLAADAAQSAHGVKRSRVTREKTELLSTDATPSPAPTPAAVDTLTRIDRPELLLVWSNLGPYHIGRCRALAAALRGKYNVVALQFGRCSTVYPWNSPSDHSGVTVLDITEGRAEDVSPLMVFRTVWRVLRERPIKAVFVAGYWPATSLAAVAAAKCARLPAIMMNASHDGTAKALGARLLVKKALIRAFDSALVGGTRHRNYFVQMGMAETKVFVGYDAVDNALFVRQSDGAREQRSQLAASLALPDRYFLALGRMVRKKNLTTIVEAYDCVRRSVANCPKLVFVGSGECQRQVEDTARSLGLAVRMAPGNMQAADVHFYGFKQIDETPIFYALAEAFILASTEEEWGLVVNEAMASSVPVIVSANAGCAGDLVVQNETGFSFDPHNVDELAGYMRMIALDPERAKNLGRAARVHIGRWGCERFAQGAVEALDAALA